MKYYRLGESEELIKEAFGIEKNDKKKKASAKKIESIRKNLENKVKGILYADVEDGVLS
jgi:hypothetical protein